MPTATLIDTDRAVKPGVRAAARRWPSTHAEPSADLAGERDREPELKAKTPQRLTLIRAAFRAIAKPHDLQARCCTSSAALALCASAAHGPATPPVTRDRGERNTGRE